MIKFSERLKEILRINNISQSDLAKLTGLTECTISRYVNGTRCPNLDNFIKICKALKRTPNTMLDIWCDWNTY